MRVAVEVLVPLRLFVFVVIHKLGGFVISPSIRNLRIFDFNQIQIQGDYDNDKTYIRTTGIIICERLQTHQSAV